MKTQAKNQSQQSKNFSFLLRYIRDTPDGSCVVEFDITPELIQYYKLHTGKKR